jgi:hypothetical protein
MAWFLKYYRHEECGAVWTGAWSCACNDRCPVCDVEIEPYKWTDISVVVAGDENSKRWRVSVSPLTAEHSPDYAISYFNQRQEADNFARREKKRLRRAQSDRLREMGVST